MPRSALWRRSRSTLLGPAGDLCSCGLIGGHNAGDRGEMLVAIVTALLAVLVFVLTQSFLTFVLEPIPVVLRQRSPLGQLWPPDERQREVLDEARLTLRGL